MTVEKKTKVLVVDDSAIVRKLIADGLRKEPDIEVVGGAADPFMHWAMTSLTPALRAAMPWLYGVPVAAITWTLLALTLGVMAWAGRHFYTRAWAAFRHHSADMITLVAVGTGAAFLYSVLATVAPGFFVAHGVAPDVYYEAVVIIIALILTGNAFEARAKRHTSTALRAGPNSTGRLVSPEMPVAFGPRNWGQSAAVSSAASSRRTRVFAAMNFFISR